MAYARQLAVVTGASSGIGFELASLCVEHGYDLIIAADDPGIATAAERLRELGAQVESVEADLSTTQGVDRLYEAVALTRRPIDALLANAGHGLGRGFLEQDFEAARHVIDTNITGTVYLIHRIGKDMQTRGEGRILITGSIAGFMPGTFQAVYNGTKAFIDSFSWALRNELKDTGVSVTCLMPGPTDTDFFDRADMLDTQVGQQRKDDPKMVAEVGFEAMLRGDGDVVAGWKNKIQSAIANVMPAGMLAEQHRKMAEPKTPDGDPAELHRGGIRSELLPHWTKPPRR
ncbi:oxidoreductase [Azorhizobium oxalatiphilum]|uniref:Oxidoreductase n=1 Tax=Azorhizobium oxalatiphilum TaxID=980631 RepID=A0A917FEE3_9HYPH|nr:SDR family NAD(P)-dependent oxidoreductase [Azorhizobium oxalatiphilum]GGF67651.1 oxidoreductase [Azorhizobium oxalatiphilum]